LFYNELNSNWLDLDCVIVLLLLTTNYYGYYYFPSGVNNVLVRFRSKLNIASSH